MEGQSKNNISNLKTNKDEILIFRPVNEEIKVLKKKVYELNRVITSMKKDLKEGKRIIKEFKKRIKQNEIDINRLGAFLEAYRRYIRETRPELSSVAERYCLRDQSFGRHIKKSVEQYINGGTRFMF